MKKLFIFIVVTLVTKQLIFGASPLGNGSNGSLTINNGVTYYIDSARAGIIGNNTIATVFLNVTNGSLFKSGDEVLIYTMIDPDTNKLNNTVGTYEYNYVVSSSQNQLVLLKNLQFSYNATGGKKHQVVKVPNYTNVTVNGTLTCSSWDGISGGILVFRVNGTITVSATGKISADGKGYRGGTQYGTSHGGGQGGESFTGIGAKGADYNVNNPGIGAGGGGGSHANNMGGNALNGGGGGSATIKGGLGSANLGGAGGGGSGHAGSGGGAGYGTFGFGGDNYNKPGKAQDGGINVSGNGSVDYTGAGGGGGGTYGISDLTKFYFGSGGGAAGRHDGYVAAAGGNGGGIVLITGKILNNAGTISSKGAVGINANYAGGGGGAGSGGSVYLMLKEITNTANIDLSGGIGGNSWYNPSKGGNGGKGILRIDNHILTNTGTINPVAYLGVFSNISTEQYKNTSNTSGVYTIKAYIFDTQGDAITTAKLYYRVNGGSFTQVTMTSGDGELFTANIPAQTVNKVIDYYVTAIAGSDNYVDPISAPVSYYTFKIIGSSPTNLKLTTTNKTISLKWSKPASLINFVNYSIYRSETSSFVPNVSNRIAQNITDTNYTDINLLDLHTYNYIIGAYYNFSGTTVFNYSSEARITVNDTSETTMSGYVFLEGESNFSNVKIRFSPNSPSAKLDSTYSNALGFFEKKINPGVYTITYEKNGFQTFPRLVTTSIVNDINLGESTLKFLGTSVKGNVKGTWNGIYSVTGDIIVPLGDTLIINQGSEIRFTGSYNFSVYGYLKAIGIMGDSILFTSMPANQIYARGQWTGIDFYDSSNDSSILKYVVVQYATDGISWDNANAKLLNSQIHNCSNVGLRIYNDNSDPIIKNVEIFNCTSHGIYSNNGDASLYNVNSHNNSGYGMYYENNSYGTIKKSKFNINSGHGILCTNWSSPTIDSCEIKNNFSWGVRIDYSLPTIDHTIVSDNIGYGIAYNHDNNNWIAPQLYNTIIEKNTNTGVYFRRYISNASKMINCTIRYNGGDGIAFFYYSNPRLYNNKIYNNDGNGIYINDADENYPLFKQNIIAYNGGDGIYKSRNGAPEIHYNTIYGNIGDGIEINTANYSEKITNNIIVDNGGYGIKANTTIEVFEYNDLYSNASGEISTLANLPANTWTFLSFNINGAPADNYLNINRDPSFELKNSLDFRLKKTSLCLNAGDFKVLDPDGTNSDLGAVPFETGCPHTLKVTGTGNASISLKWSKTKLDTLVRYNIYYKLAASPSYSYFNNTTDTLINVTGLTNNVNYDFVVTGLFPHFESGYSPKVTEKPGIPQITINPIALNVMVDVDTVTKTLIISNPGTKELKVNLPLGVESGYAHFNGSNDYLQVGDFTHLEGMSALTLECWVRNNNLGWTEPIGKHYTQYSLTMDISNNNFGMYKGWDGSNYEHFYGYYDFEPGNWYHLAVTWNTNLISFYVNGQLVNQYDNVVSYPIATNGVNFQMGRRADESNYYLNGDLSEVRVWNIVRTQEQLNDSKDSPLKGNETGLVGYWPLHKNFNDASSYIKNATPNYSPSIVATQGPGISKVPYILSKQQLTLAPGATDSIKIKFYKTGQNGTFVYTTPIRTNIATMPEIDYEIALTYGSKVPSTPVYFTPVASTGKPYPIYITDAEIDKVNIQVGDEIAVYDGSLCVGAGIFDGSFNFALTAWENGATSGFISGHAMTFKIYDKSVDLETIIDSVVYSVGNGNFGYGKFSSLRLVSTIYRVQDVPVAQNQFELVSFNRLPRYPQSATIFNVIDSLKIAYSDDGKALIPKYNINTIGDIDFRKAFYVYSTKKDTFKYQGTSINPTKWNITVKKNKWNYISYLGETPMAITAAFVDSIKSKIDVVQSSDGKMWSPSLAINTIGNMIPGRGYMIALNSANDLVFNYQTTNGLKSSSIKSTNPPSPVHYTVNQTGLPYNIVIVNPTIDSDTLKVGDEIAAFDNGICVGVVVYTGQEKTVLTTWQKDDTYELQGYTPLNNLVIKVFSIQDGQEYGTTITSLTSNPNNLKYAGGNYSIVSVNALKNVININDLSIIPSITYYPNPFTEEIEFNYSLAVLTKVNLTITDVLGRRVAVLVNDNLQAGNYNIKWNGLKSNTGKISEGVYNFIFITGDKTITGKIVCIQ